MLSNITNPGLRGGPSSGEKALDGTHQSVERGARVALAKGICGRDGRATASVRGDGGSIPTGGALEVLPCDFGPKQFGWLIHQLGEP